MSLKSIIQDASSRLGNVYLSEGSLKSAFYKVRRELREMGLLSDGSKLDKVKIIHETFSWDALRGLGGLMGLYDFEDHNIHIPTVCSAALAPWCSARCMADVIRHEFGHAMQDKYYRYFMDDVFINAFGDVCGDNKVFVKGEEKNYVSKYARTNTQEDFAETFMLYMKHKGKLPKEFSRRKMIKAKWATVESICGRIVKLKK